MTKTEHHNLMKASRHEACHLAVLEALGGKVKGAWIDKEGRGKVVEERALPPESQAAYLVAGDIAERGLSHDRPFMCFSDAAREDEQKLKALHARTGGTEPFRTWLCRAWTTAARILRSKPDRIKFWQDELLQLRSFDAPQVYKPETRTATTPATGAPFTLYGGKWSRGGKSVAERDVPQAIRERAKHFNELAGRGRQTHSSPGAACAVRG